MESPATVQCFTLSDFEKVKFKVIDILEPLCRKKLWHMLLLKTNRAMYMYKVQP